MDIVSKPNNDRHVLSFSRKLFLSVISLFLVFAVCFIAYQYQREKEYKVELLDTQLQDYNERLQQELRSTPDSLWTSVLNQYIVKGANKDLRVTIVNLHGDVLYDSYNETSQEVFNNHINRQEIQKALKNGKGYDLRRTSETTKSVRITFGVIQHIISSPPSNNGNIVPKRERTQKPTNGASIP